MLSIVDQAPVNQTPVDQPAVDRTQVGPAPAAVRNAAPPEDKAAPEPQPQESPEYEIVLGRAQIASWLFVGVIAIAACSSLAFLAGKAAGAKKPAAQIGRAHV